MDLYGQKRTLVDLSEGDTSAGKVNKSFSDGAKRLLREKKRDHGDWET